MSFFQHSPRDVALPGESLIFQGAESLTFLTPFFPSPSPNSLVLRKNRPPKPYRHPQLDRQLTKHRILSECRILQKARKAGVRVPGLIMLDVLRGDIYMTFIHGVSIRDYLLPITSITEETRKVIREIGKVVAMLHRNDIVHGDLTTSNLLLSPESEVWVIDFGLSSVSLAVDDMAVDLYVLQRSLTATHSKLDGLMEDVMNGYTDVITTGWKKGKEVIKRLELVRMRGRKRTMVG